VGISRRTRHEHQRIVFCPLRRSLALAADPEFAVLNESSLMCARNEELCSLDEPLVDGDEVAFFPPVTGG
jgi:molybdopterin converting factor small subunit